MKITKDTTIAEVIDKHPGKAEVMQRYLQASCLGCPMSQMETLEDAAEHHEVDLEELLEELNK